MADQSNIILQIIARLRDEISAPLTKVKQTITGIKPEPLVNVGKAGREAGAGARDAAAGAHELEGGLQGILQAATGISAGLGLTSILEKLREEFVAVLERSLEFEKSLQRLQIRSGESISNASKFNDELRDLGATFGSTAVEAARSASIVAEQTGLRGDAILRFLRTAEQLKTLGLGTLDESVLLTSQTVKAFGLEMDKAGETMFKVFAIAQKSKTSFREIADSIILLGVAARESGVKLEEIGAVVQDLSNAGLTGAQINAGIGKFLLALGDKTDPVRQKIEKLTGALGENYIEQKGFINFLAELRDLSENAPGGQQQFFSEIAGGPRSAKAILTLLDDIPKLKKESTDFTGSFAEGLGKVNEILSETDERIKQTRARIQNSTAGIGDTLVQAAAPLLEGFNETLILITKGGSAAVKQANRDVEAGLNRELELLNRRADAIYKGSQAYKDAQVQAAKTASEVARFTQEQLALDEKIGPTIEEQFNVDRVKEAIGKLRLALKGGLFGPEAFTSDQVPREIRAQFESLQRFLEVFQRTGRVAPFSDELKAALPVIDAVTKAEGQLSIAATAMAIANEDAGKRAVHAIDEQIARVEEEIAVRRMELDDRGRQIRSTDALEAQVAALQESREQAVTKDVLAHSFALDKQRKTVAGLATTFALFGAQVAKNVAIDQKFEDDLKKLDERAASLREKIQGQQNDAFSFALQPQIQIDTADIEAQIKQKVTPLLNDVLAIDPADTEAVRAAMDKLIVKVRQLKAEMADFGRGFSAGITDKLSEFADQTRQGYQLAQTAVESFTQHTADAIQGLLEGTANLRDILRGFLSDIAGAISRILSERLIAGLIGGAAGGGGFAGFGNATGFSAGGVVAGGLLAPHVQSYAPGGIAVGPQLALIGDNRAQREAIVPLGGPGRGIPVEFKNGGGGGNVTVHVSYVVQAIDARGVREMLVEHGRTIGDIAADQIRTGRHAGLRDSVRRAR